MSDTLQLELDGRIENLVDLNDGIDTFAAQHSLARSTVFDLRLVLEELIVNVINYAYDDPEKPKPVAVTLDMVKYGEAVGVVIEDSGRSFNPLDQITDENPTADPDSLGGFGIFLVQQKTRDLDYQRRDGKTNRVTFWIDAQRESDEKASTQQG